MRQKLILYEMNYHVPYCMSAHVKHNEMHISNNMRYTSHAYNLYCFRKRSKEVQAEKRYC